jgi:hypothetical protein
MAGLGVVAMGSMAVIVNVLSVRVSVTMIRRQRKTVSHSREPSARRRQLA